MLTKFRKQADLRQNTHPNGNTISKPPG